MLAEKSMAMAVVAGIMSTGRYSDIANETDSLRVHFVVRRRLVYCW
jgi:hypothetical protein